MIKETGGSMTFGDRLAYARNKKGLQQKHLAELIGVTQGSLSRWETGRNKPDMSMIRKIIKTLEVSEDWLIENNNFRMNWQDIRLTKEQQRLTKEQQKLIIENENLIYFQMRKMHITDFEEFYGSAAYGLCKAARDYDPSKGAFSTLATLYIRNEILMDKREWKRSLHPLISIDQKTEFDHGGDTEESIIQIPAEDEILPLEYKILVESVYQKVEYVLTAKEKVVFRPWLHGKRGSEIAREMGFKTHTVEKKIRNAKKKCKTFFNADEIFT